MRKRRTVRWRNYARCRGADVNLFHAEEKHWAIYSQTKAEYCSLCSVQVECLLYALENDIPEGIWGGLTPGDRKLLKRHVEVRSRDSAAIR